MTTTKFLLLVLAGGLNGYISSLLFNQVSEWLGISFFLLVMSILTVYIAHLAGLNLMSLLSRLKPTIPLSSILGLIQLTILLLYGAVSWTTNNRQLLDVLKDINLPVITLYFITHAMSLKKSPAGIINTIGLVSSVLLFSSAIIYLLSKYLGADTQVVDNLEGITNFFFFISTIWWLWSILYDEPVFYSLEKSYYFNIFYMVPKGESLLVGNTRLKSNTKDIASGETILLLIRSAIMEKHSLADDEKITITGIYRFSSLKEADSFYGEKPSN